MDGQVIDEGERVSDATIASMRVLLERQRAAFLDEGPVSAEVRIDRLDRLIALLTEHREPLADAMRADFGHRPKRLSLLTDVSSTLDALKFNRKHLRKWMRRERRKPQRPLSFFGVRVWVDYHPKGVVGVLGTWNFPLYTVLSPLAGALAAGNRAMVKFAEVAPATADLMGELLAERFDELEIGCVAGGPDVGAAFSALPFDHLIFTGGGSIGKKVLRAAADNLTPVTLELGGKSPVIIAPDAELKETAFRIMNGKGINGGQVCLSPDYVFAPRDQLEAFIEHASETWRQMFPTIVRNDDYTSIVNERHHRRLQSYLTEAVEAGADVREINPADESFDAQQGTHKMPLTFLVDPDDSLRITQEEIFGPIMIVKGYDQIDDCVRYINSRPRPLSLYLFTNDAATRELVLSQTLSGGVTINDVMMQASCNGLPFGGIGPSGMGHYNGHDGFKMFSHARAVYKQSRINLQRLAGLVPPYGERFDKTLEGLIEK